MRVFVTGASGFIGAAVTKDLISHGHEVIGLARNDSSADTITKLGGTPHKGHLFDLDSLKIGAASADAVIHLAFVHDFSGPDSPTNNCATDRDAISAMGEAISGTGKPFIIASGTLGLQEADGKPATEDTPGPRGSGFFDRTLSADLVQRLSKEQNIRGMVVRLAPIVHENGRGGFLTILPPIFRQAGFAGYIGDGENVWPAAHNQDIAVLFRLALEKGTAGAIYHGTSEEAVKTKDIVEAVGKKMGLSVESKSVEEAAVLGFVAHVLVMNDPTSSVKTQRELGWKPVQRGLLEDIEKGEIGDIDARNAK
ncbi:hypothetical protein DOTSEDRAFT_70065 [Dothistroma septosporum NZE10]|uniref:NAD-dependent epimerase/dehydratase domain-containing protein n=1 Tax=Dothistroma septosporum (strain NZE10 / CBS 128990) TaxID=675120 RepID=N1PRA8_DOTSN|nr:hypothetical protein DOTSEDRAFT_70065 [Dothistroma septosporum NZE10]